MPKKTPPVKPDLHGPAFLYRQTYLFNQSSISGLYLAASYFHFKEEGDATFV
ncbi:hypothetical protein [Echinicola rosea]|uniref:hypothetical protein n=1 Tax=Echinicola rosea TaxID=1807691 RepID=UPI00166BCA1E|nr:hypothetical protein [Echinicola rosea]